MNKTVIIILLSLVSSICLAQETMYVNADNGLIVREKPNRNSKRIGKFTYAEKVRVQEKTNIQLSIIDDGKKIDGSWYKVRGLIKGELKSGYVFSGFLVTEKLMKRLQINFPDFTFEMDYTETMEETFKIQNDTAYVTLDLSGTLEGKFLKIFHKKYQKVEVFQCYENSVTIMDEGPHCDLTEWKHYYSEWKELPYFSDKNSFKTFKHSEQDSERFISIKIEELKKAVANFCGERWSNLINNIKHANEYPSGITTSRILLKIILTDKNNHITKKLIVFELPMGC